MNCLYYYKKIVFRTAQGKFEKQTTWPAEEGITERSERSESKRTMWRILNALIAVAYVRTSKGWLYILGKCTRHVLNLLNRK